MGRGARSPGAGRGPHFQSRTDSVKYVAFIPLRGGSKSIPGKNIRPIAGKPLCQWVIEAAVGSRLVDAVFVATDSDEIRRVVQSFGLPKLEVVGRSPATATDTASTESAMIEFAEAREFEHLVLIQATSPLLRTSDLDAAIERYAARGADSLVSVVPQKRFIWSVDAEGWAVPRNYDPAARPRRQDFEPHYVENGALYVCRREGLLRTKSRLFGKIVTHVMAEETFHELDEPIDYRIIEPLLLERQRQHSSLAERARRIRLVLTDVDGVLTDAGMYYSEAGDELKKFSTRDGKGFELLRTAGFRVGLLTSERTALVERRAAKLKLDIVRQGAVDKVPVFEEILAETGLTPADVAYMGDDLADLPVLERVGLAACPADAISTVRERVHYVSSKPGGAGCFRDLAELILQHREQDTT